MPQLWEVRKGAGVHQSQLKNQAADVLTSATTSPRSDILALAVVGFALAPQNGAKLFVYLFIYLFWHKWKYPLQKGRGRILLYIFKFSFFAFLIGRWPQNVSFYLYYPVTYTARESST
jgi:hypothetical protein